MQRSFASVESFLFLDIINITVSFEYLCELMIFPVYFADFHKQGTTNYEGPVPKNDFFVKGL